MPDLALLDLKDPKDFNYIGRGLPVVDLEDMTTGDTVYGVDVYIPHMVYASIERAPFLDGKIKSYDAAAAKKVPGVLSVHEVKGKALPAVFNALEATYKPPFLAHASMESPMAAAPVHNDMCEIWACTQTPQTTQHEVAKALGYDVEKVKVHVTLLGGGFDRKSKPVRPLLPSTQYFSLVPSR